MSNGQTTAVHDGVVTAGLSGNCLSRALKSTADKSLHFFVGLGVLFALWGVGIYVVTLNPTMAMFGDFGPIPALEALPELWEYGTIPNALVSTGYRMAAGLGLAIIIGIPLGILIGRIRWFQRLTNVPFQFLRMISPLSWEPIAVVVFSEWDQAIIFLLAIAAVWPVMFATASGLAKIDPAWFKVSRNLGAKPWHMVTRIIMPAVTFDILTGIRLALGVAWIVIIPAEFLGVTSGFGFAVEDAREGLEYAHLMGLILVIGVVGFVLDSICVLLIKRFSWHRG